MHDDPSVTGHKVLAVAVAGEVAMEVGMEMGMEVAGEGAMEVAVGVAVEVVVEGDRPHDPCSIASGPAAAQSRMCVRGEERGDGARILLWPKFRC